MNIKNISDFIISNQPKRKPELTEKEKLSEMIKNYFSGKKKIVKNYSRMKQYHTPVKNLHLDDLQKFILAYANYLIEKRKSKKGIVRENIEISDILNNYNFDDSDTEENKVLISDSLKNLIKKGLISKKFIPLAFKNYSPQPRPFNYVLSFLGKTFRFPGEPDPL